MGVAPTQGYQRREPGGTAAFGGSSASAFGAEVGAGMAALGQALHEDDLETRELELKRRRDAEVARAGRDLARLDSQMGEWARDARLHRRDDHGEATGHTDAGLAEFDQRSTAFLDTIGNPQVREQYEGRIAELRGRFQDREGSWEQVQRAGAQATNTTEANRQRALNLATRPFNLAELDQAVAEANADLTLQTGLAPEVRDHARSQFSRELAIAAIDAGTEQNPAAMLTLLQGGQFNRYGLTAEDIRSKVDIAQAEINAAEARTRAARSELRGQVTAQAQLMDRRIRDGELPSDAELAALQEQARAAGMEAEVYDAGNYRLRTLVNRQYGPQSGQTPQQIRAALDGLDAQIAAAGANVPTELRIQRDQLNTLLEVATRTQQNDPYRGYAQRGGRMVPVNAADRASIEARVTAMHATGTSQFFMPQELPARQQRFAEGTAGRLDVANEVARIGAVDPRAADAAARQIAPNDATFRIAVRLNPAVRARVIRGAEARRQLPQQLTMPDGSHPSFDQVTQTWFQLNIGPQLRGLNPEDVNGVLEAARSSYAENARAHGNLANPNFNEQAFGEAVSDVLGRTDRGGGTGYWDFGPNGQPLTSGRRPGIVLPTRMTQQRLDTVMTWMPIARLGEREWPRGSAPNGGPRWANGSAVSVDDIRGRFVPLMVDDGVYEFHAADGTVLEGATGHFRLDVYALEAHGPPRRPGAPPMTRAERDALDAGRREYDRRRRQAEGQ